MSEKTDAPDLANDPLIQQISRTTNLQAVHLMALAGIVASIVEKTDIDRQRVHQFIAGFAQATGMPAERRAIETADALLRAAKSGQ